jgi:hypothetical protein
VFAAAFGVAPKPVFSWSAETPNLSTLKFDGTVGSFYVVIMNTPGLLELQPKAVLQLHIWPDWSLAKMLGCGPGRSRPPRWGRPSGLLCFPRRPNLGAAAFEHRQRAASGTPLAAEAVQLAPE